MSDHDSPQEIHKAVRRYLLVFGALIVGTIFTVVASRFPIESVAITVIIALAIACVKGFLVAGYFMHLISEKKMIYGILIATVFFFAGLMYLTVWSMNKESLIHMQEPATTQHVP
jgi:cytochrome c oxidase subunit IV